MKKFFLAGALLLAMLLPPSSAVAAPTGEYAQFAKCPLTASPLFACLYSESSNGFFTIGKKTVPIKNKVVLQGGLSEFSVTPVPLLPASGGETLVKTPQPVPGGLLGVTAPSWWPQFLKDLFNETINNGFTGVQATVELAGPASGIKLNSLALVSASGTALSLPVKVKLDNPFLGSSCYIGSNSTPMVLNFTSGTTAPPPPNTPITGNPGTVSENASNTIATFSGGKLVDNAFAAPGANGCGGLFSFLIDPFVNSILGAPSPAGTNTAVLEGKIQLGQPAAIKASEP
jgi:hypothetical protein